jgi:hypothetical protein
MSGHFHEPRSKESDLQAERSNEESGDANTSQFHNRKSILKATGENVWGHLIHTAK